MLTLQISAIADALHLLNDQLPVNTLAFAYCAMMVLFAILFGARHVSPRENTKVWSLPLRWESLVKLIAIGILAGFIFMAGVCPNRRARGLAGTGAYRARAAKHDPARRPWRTLLLVFFAAAVVMPHMFHMTFTESLNSDALKPASWGFPLFYC